VKTNVWGTQNVLEVAADHGVERFVNISTDKAADPVSVLGYTKRISERLTATAAANTGRPYLSVRFGNVLGTRGSVVPSFQTQIEAGGPVTVTDAEVTRFFMTIKEAVQLVIQAGAIGMPGGVLILDMGEPVSIADLARILIAASGKEIEITYTGLRPGEKVHEQLVDGDETPMSTAHPLILQASVPSVDLGELHEALRPRGIARAECIEQLARLAGSRGSPSRTPS
jgi:FlaA1/EpsC-like NDP-sugar epimerase